MATSFYNPRTGSWGAGYRYGNGYQGWGQGVVQRGNQWARGGYYYDDRGAIGGVRTSQGGGLLAAGNGDNRGAIARTSDGDLYAGKDGNIYKRDQSGNWSQRGNNGWNAVDTSKLSQEQQQRLNDARSKQPQSRQSGASSNRAQPGTLGSGSASQSGRIQPGTLPSAGSANLARQPGQTRSSLGSGAAGSRGSSEMRSSSIDRDTMGGLDRDARARSSGSRNYDSWQGSRGSYSGRGYSGGMRRGGGRRR